MGAVDHCGSKGEEKKTRRNEKKWKWLIAMWVFGGRCGRVGRRENVGRKKKNKDAMGEKWELTHVRVRGERKEWKNGEGEEWGGRPVGSVAKRKEKKLDKLWGLPSTLPWE